MTWDNFKTNTLEMPVSRINQGLRAYMQKVYAYMAGGLVLSGLCAFIGSKPPFINALYNISPQGASLSLFGWIVLLAPLVLIFMFQSAVGKLNVGRAQTIFWAFSALMGFSLSTIFLVYSGESLLTTFLVTAGSFGGLSLFGYVTKKDLSGFGSFLIMGLWGIILAMIVNFFLKSPGVAYGISILGVLIFAGLTAWDTQRIRQMYSAAPEEAHQALAISGALALYLDFIYLFLFLLRFMGNSRN